MPFSALRSCYSYHYQPLDVELDSERKAVGERSSRNDGRRRRPLLPALIIIAGLTVIATGAVVTLSTDVISNIVGDPFSHETRCPTHQCPTDPFTKAGVLHFGAYPNETRWIPFPNEPNDALENPLYSETAIDYDNNDIDPKALMGASPQYMKLLAAGDAAMSWVKNRTVLFVGTSHDRNAVEFFCQYVGGKYISIGAQTGGWCHVAKFNFTLVNWFLFGMVDGEYEWFHSPKDTPMAFERRIPEKMLPMMGQAGVAGTPDLVFYGSQFWDERFLEERERKYGARTGTSLTYTELNWHRSRVHALVKYLRNLYGDRVPIMFRTRHLKHDNGGNGILRIFQLDQSMRAIADELGIKLFLWGSKLEGQTEMFYDKVHHFEKGGATFLFGDMMLFYLKRATTPECWQCRQQHD